MEGSSNSTDTNKGINEEVIKEEEMDKLEAVTHTDDVPIGVVVANTRHKDTVMKECSETGWK
eukprot:2776632-Ditylum_brightwellii.AAC.1